MSPRAGDSRRVLTCDFATRTFGGDFSGTPGQQVHFAPRNNIARLGGANASAPEVWFTLTEDAAGKYPARMLALPFTWSPLQKGVRVQALSGQPVPSDGPIIRAAGAINPAATAAVFEALQLGRSR